MFSFDLLSFWAASITKYISGRREIHLASQLFSLSRCVTLCVLGSGCMNKIEMYTLLGSRASLWKKTWMLTRPRNKATI